MAFDCYCIDFQNKKSKENINKLKQIFPYVKVLPFIQSYYDLSKVVLESTNTEYVWMLSSKIDYSKFDFNYIPEQFEAKQLHTWSCPMQKEGDTFLFHKSFTTHNIKFLRDFKHVNYHTENLDYDNDIEEVEFNLSNIIESLPNNKIPNSQYIRYYETGEKEEIFYPSYWEDLKIYLAGKTFYVPRKALQDIRTQLYDYSLLYTIKNNDKKDCFDVAFISNGEPFEQDNFNILEKHIKKNNLKNKLYWVKNVKGRSQAYKEAAKQSNTEYFYAVFAKSIVAGNFMFDYTIDRCLTKRHYIFHSRLEELDLDYGTFNINIYNKSLCLDTANDNILDFTLSQPHEVVPIIASTSLLAPDNYTAWKNAFREVSKLILWNEHKPTVETSYRLKKWKATEHKWLARGSKDAEDFVKECAYNEDKILQTYTWDFCRSKFKSLYPTETFY